jgi:hypothetical protein
VYVDEDACGGGTNDGRKRLAEVRPGGEPADGVRTRTRPRPRRADGPQGVLAQPGLGLLPAGIESEAGLLILIVHAAHGSPGVSTAATVWCGRVDRPGGVRMAPRAEAAVRVRCRKPDSGRDGSNGGTNGGAQSMPKAVPRGRINADLLRPPSRNTPAASVERTDTQGTVESTTRRHEGSACMPCWLTAPRKPMINDSVSALARAAWLRQVPFNRSFLRTLSSHTRRVFTK